MKLFKRSLIFLLALLVIGSAGLAYWAYQTFSRVEGQYFDSNGVRIHYTDQGQGEPVVLVHGFAFDSDLNWRNPGVIERLSENYRVIALDNRGHGLSDKPHAAEAYGEEMPRDIVRLLDHLGIEKAHVVGYSMGGFITLKLMTLYPERLLSAAPCGIGWQEPTKESAALAERIAKALEDEHSFAPLLEFLEIDAEEGSLALAIGDWFLGARNDFDALACVMRAFHEFAVSPEALHANTVPALCIVGGQDPLAANVSELRDLAANFGVVEVAGAGHATVPGTPVFIRTLEKFLGDPAGELTRISGLQESDASLQ